MLIAMDIRSNYFFSRDTHLEPLASKKIGADQIVREGPFVWHIVIDPQATTDNHSIASANIHNSKAYSDRLRAGRMVGMLDETSNEMNNKPRAVRSVKFLSGEINGLSCESSLPTGGKPQGTSEGGDNNSCNSSPRFGFEAPNQFKRGDDHPAIMGAIIIGIAATIIACALIIESTR
jgi:hypothetical protein